MKVSVCPCECVCVWGEGGGCVCVGGGGCIHIEGFRSKWYISTVYHAWDTPVWPGTLELWNTNNSKLTHVWLLPENIGYTLWLLLLLFSVHASAMSKLQNEIYLCLSQLYGWDKSVLFITAGKTTGTAWHILFLVTREVSHSHLHRQEWVKLSIQIDYRVSNIAIR